MVTSYQRQHSASPHVQHHCVHFYIHCISILFVSHLSPCPILYLAQGPQHEHVRARSSWDACQLLPGYKLEGGV